MKQYHKNNFSLRMIQGEDIEGYYDHNYHPLNPDLVRYTGCKPDFTFEEIDAFIRMSIVDETRFHFVLLNPDGRIIGEAVLSDYDTTVMAAHFRLAIFDPSYRGLGLGQFMVTSMLDFGFSFLKLHRFELQVYSYNIPALSLYRQFGFVEEGVLRDALIYEGLRHDIILMALLDSEYQS